MKPHLMILAGVVLALLLGAPNPARAEDPAFQCATSGLSVHSADPVLAERLCETAAGAMPQIEACGLRQTRPIEIRIVEQVRDAAPNCVGAFHCRDDLVEVLTPEQLENRPELHSVYVGLDPRAVMDSVLVHELTHALLHHTLDGREISLVAHEYISYAIQIEALAPEDREVFLDRNGRKPPPSLDIFNGLILGLAPGRFATMSWHHFSAPQNGCDFVDKLISGEVRLVTLRGP